MKSLEFCAVVYLGIFAFVCRSKQAPEPTQVGILGKPVLDFTPFLEPKPEPKKEETSESNETSSCREEESDAESSDFSLESDGSSSSLIHSSPPSAQEVPMHRMEEVLSRAASGTAQAKSDG